MSDEHRWEWTLAGRTRVAATLDPDMRVESVYVGARLVSKADRGTRPEGHVVPYTRDGEALPVVVTFDPRVLVCILRLDDQEVPPDVWPVRKRAPRAVPRTFTFPIGIVAAVVLILAAVGGVLVVRDRLPTRVASDEAGGAHRAENGLFVAHFPPTFAARRAVVPSGLSGVVLEERTHGDAVVILALPPPESPRDPWLLQKKLHAEALANVPRAKGGHEELARTDDTCLGQPGAAVRGRIRTVDGTARMWACAFVKDDAGYLAAITARDTATPEEEAALRDVLEATELTRLGEIRTAP